ncbi:MAG TPA: isoprenylcysteine carboxylmethyltransferase family protein [Nitrospirota bacterium]|nr:isoprenylcysteine carboxylmethyltransferase family protein [Nitrospirota bacterium]
MNNLTRKTILGYLQLIIGLGIMLFAPGGTFDFLQAWAYLLVFALSTALITAYLRKKDPQLLVRRVKAGPAAEKVKIQKRIQFFAAIAFIGMFILASLDHRFSWSDVPLSIVITGDVLVMCGFLIIFVVFKENTFSAAIIEVATGQKVISTGPYAIIRHPMYLGALVMLFGTPLALASWWGLLMSFSIASVIVWRILEEEKFLSIHLPGYSDYKKKVPCRLVPFVW